ncbi:MAG: hypothetical protein JWM11_7551 [Planctomycetaceae bacterium]|nr:hypothetical protein [Planctomycetaceae bacterium]
MLLKSGGADSSQPCMTSRVAKVARPWEDRERGPNRPNLWQDWLPRLRFIQE